MSIKNRKSVIFASIITWLKMRITRNELMSLSKKDLRDIGLNECDFINETKRILSIW